MNINTCLMGGNLCRDPELRYTASGKAVAGGTIAMTRKWKDEAGAQKDKTTFLDFTAWGRTGELVAEYFKKGQPILLQGRLDLEEWEDKQTGQKRSKIKLTVEQLHFLPSGPRKPAEGTDAAPTDAPAGRLPMRPGKAAAAAEAATDGAPPIEEDDVPF